MQLLSVFPDDQRTTPQLKKGEVVSNRVEISTGEKILVFTVFIRANVLPAFDASLVYGEPSLEDHLRHRPDALNRILGAVGRIRKGQQISLPMQLGEPPTAHTGSDQSLGMGN